MEKKRDHQTQKKIVYRTHAIISRGLHIFYPISKDHFFVFKVVFSENYVFMYGLYSRAAYDGARTVCKHLMIIGWCTLVELHISISSDKRVSDICSFKVVCVKNVILCLSRLSHKMLHNQNKKGLMKPTVCIVSILEVVYKLFSATCNRH